MKYLYLLTYLIIIILLINILINNNIIYESYKNNKIVIHKIQLNPEATNGFPPGFGDILKGTVSLYKISKEYGYTFYLDLTEHPISKYIIQTIPNNLTNLNNKVHEYFDIPNHNDLITIINKIIHMNDIALFQTNRDISILNELDKNDKKNLQNIIKPNNYLQNKIDEIKKKFNLNNYSVLHIRTGDYNINKSINSNNLISIEKTLSKINLPENILLLSDSYELKEFLSKKYKYKIINSEIIHLGNLNSNNKEQAIESTLIDFFLISGSNKIYSLSVYDWNSGFSTMASKLYDISIEKYKL